MADSTDVKGQMNAIVTKERPLSDEDIAELLKLIGLAEKLDGMSFGGMTFSDKVHFRMNVELIAAIRTFDKASADLITTTNKLTNRILFLTYVVVGLGLISAIPAVLQLFRFH